MKIEWAARARTDIRELRRYITQDSPHYARRFVDKIFQAGEKLPEHPASDAKFRKPHATTCVS